MRYKAIILPTKEEEIYISDGTCTLPKGIKQYVFVGILKCIQEFYPNGWKRPNFNELSLNGFDNPLGVCYSPEIYQPQHLYIVDTKCPIKKGDIAIKGDGKLHEYEVRKMNYDFNSELINDSTIWHKVIASSDKSLGLQPIPKHLVESYIFESNLVITDLQIIDGSLRYAIGVEEPEPALETQEPKVDFELLKVTISKLNLCEIDSEESMFSLEEDRNLKLFFQSMKKSSFAHKASKLL